MKNMLLASVLAGAVASGVWAAPNDPVTQADLEALIARIARLEAENRAQAAKIAELEGKLPAAAPEAAGAVQNADGMVSKTAAAAPAVEAGTEVGGTGRLYTTGQGYRYYLADKVAGILSRRCLDTLSSTDSNPSSTASPTASPVTVLLAL